MKTKDILIDIIENLEAYEQLTLEQKTEPTTSDFLEYMNMQFHPLDSSKRELISGGDDSWRLDTSRGADLTTDVSILVVMLYRYARGYIKKALTKSEIKNGDDFSFLITLMTYESRTKIELTKMLVMEKTSGNEIIKRLVNQKFIEQTPDSEDRRSVRIRITDFGREQVIKILPEMQLVSKIVTGNMNESEIRTFSYLLRKLDDYHNDIYHNKKELELPELVYDQNS